MAKSKAIVEALDQMSLTLHGRARSKSIATETCVGCGKPATVFKDELSRKEFALSGYCQVCQDEIFGG